jgi:hypothetical protein
MSGLEIERYIFDGDERRLSGAREGLMHILEVPERGRWCRDAG